MENKVLLIDDYQECELQAFIKDNSTEDVDKLTTDEINLINNLKVNESVYIGIVEVKRIK